MIQMAHLSIVALAFSMICGIASADTTLGYSTRSTNATAFAITYGYPLTQYISSLQPILSTIGANAIFHGGETAHANETSVVRPNVDTFYSIFAVDLSSNDVALTIPNVGDNRYYVVPFYDLWSNNFANLGSLNATKPGKYLLRFAQKSHQIGFEAAEASSDYLGYINYPTVYGLSLPRILLRNNNTDVENVRAIQAGFTVAVVPRQGSAMAPKLTSATLGGSALLPLAKLYPGSLDSTSVQHLLEVVAKVAPYNPPTEPDEAHVVTQTLKDAGVLNGQYVSPPDVNFITANQLVNISLASTQPQPFNNNWAQFPPNFDGDFHTQYATRALAAFNLYLMLAPFEAIYPQYISSGITDFSLKANESYIFTFSGKPLVNGFWSLTAYNTSGFLIPNENNIFALGDRSNLTYPNGQLIYGNTERNDPFSILIQPADLTPPLNWTSNWLPAPAGGGNFSITLRFYGPTKPLLAGGTYKYPDIAKQGAIIIPEE